MRIGTATSVLFRYAIQDAIALVARIGFEGVDIWGGRPHVYRQDMTPEELVHLRSVAADHGLSVVSFMPAFYRYPHSLSNPNPSESGITNGIVVVYSQHTTCSVLIQEDSIDMTLRGTKYVHQDLLNVLDGVIPPRTQEGQYLHPGPKCVRHSVDVIGEAPAWTLNTDAHLRSCLLGRSESIPIASGKLVLGEHGHVYFAAFDGTRPRKRVVHVQIVGDRQDDNEKER